MGMFELAAGVEAGIFAPPPVLCCIAITYSFKINCCINSRWMPLRRSVGGECEWEKMVKNTARFTC